MKRIAAIIGNGRRPRRRAARRVRGRRARFGPSPLERLEPRLMLAGSVVISEFMANNDSTLADEDGDYSDWIELHNPGDEPIGLSGWHLTDDQDDLNRWEFPDVAIPAGGYLTVFASGKDRVIPGSTLHTDFQLEAEGEYLALVRPDGDTVVQEFAPAFPPQLPDVSYGLFESLGSSQLVSSGDPARMLVPKSQGDIAEDWYDVEFDDSAWPAAADGAEGPLPAGYDRGNPAEIPADGLQLWLRADQGVVTVDNSAQGGTSTDVSRWEDQSGLGHHAVQTVTSRQPALIQDALNGRPVLRFDQDYFNDVTVGSVGNEFSFFAVLKAEPLGQYHNVFERASAVRPMLWIRNTNEYEFNFSESAGGIQAGVIDNSWDIVGGVVRASGTRQSLYLNGPSAHSSNAGFDVPAGNSAYRLFNRNGAQIYEGDFAELIVYHDALTTQEVDRIGGYLREKYGIDSTFDIPSVESLIQTDVSSLMYQQATTLMTRQTFDVADPSLFDRLELEARYDDGFVAYLNGQEIARRNAFGSPGTPVAYYDGAAGVHSAQDVEKLDLTANLDLLRAGPNVLALHGLNIVSADTDFVIGAALTGFDVTPLDVASRAKYFLSPSPGGLNGTEPGDRGPVITDVGHQPRQPVSNQDLVVTAAAGDPQLDAVTLHYRVMFDSENQLPMLDDGQGVDAVAGDGIYSAAIPGGAYQAGEMVRYYVTADNAGSSSSRWPLFFDPLRSDQYLGTVVADPSLESRLPVLHWFVEDTSGADNVNRTGARASLYYDGEFYDNVFNRVRGASSAAEPKKPYKFDFHPGHFFKYRDDRPRVEEINVNTTFQDKAYLRTALAHNTLADMDVPSSDAMNLRVQRNGQFFSVAVFVEQVDDIFLERNGLDPEGALYKMFNGITSATSGVEKKTRLEEDAGDLQALVAGLSPSNPDRTLYVMDHVDLPAAINYATSGIIIQDFDRGAKNFYVYRDTEGSGEWTQIPWDEDLTFGNRFYSDEISGNGGRGHGIRSHPFWGESEHNLFGTNMMIDAIVDDPVTREMYLRRLRTLMDEFLQAPGTPPQELKFEQRIDEMAADLADDAALDLAKWGAIYGIVRDLPTEVGLLKNNYLAERRVHLFETHSQVHVEPTTTIISGTPGETTAWFMAPTDDSLGITWTEAVYQPGPDWTLGVTGVGYETSPADYQNLIRSGVQPNTVCPECTSLLVRIPFTVDDVGELERLTLRMKYDDGFVAYINGQEVARQNIITTSAGTPPSYSDLAALHDDSAAVLFEDFDVSSAIARLNQGTDNVLAIHALNTTVGSSDLLVLPELVEGLPSTDGSVGIPGPQPDFASMPPDQRGIGFGTIEFSPASGNQDEEYVQINNDNDIAIDISGWELDGAVSLTFRPGTVIPSGGVLYVSPDVRAFRARVTGPGGGQGLLVQGNYGGHLSSFGETLVLRDEAGREIVTTTYAGDPSALQEHLRVTEINYNPLGPSDEELAIDAGLSDDDFEFIEFLNDGPDELVLNGVRITSGVQFTFGAVTLQPGERGVVVGNSAAFPIRYGDQVLVLGQFDSGSLSSGGETIKIEDPAQSTIQEFAYDDEGAWPELADGRGATLEVIDLAGDYDGAANWRDSGEFHGSPGLAGTGPTPGVVINEVLSHTDPPQLDSVELFNPTAAPIDVSGWLLSDTSDEYYKYRFPVDTIVPAGGYLTVDETDFNASMGSDPADFALDGAHGDQLYLLQADGADRILSFADHVEFDAAANGESYGRWPNGAGVLYPMSSLTLGDENSGPRIGPLYISELMYHPAAQDPDIDDGDLEFVEIHNPTGVDVPLTHWTLSGGIDFEFPVGTVLPAGATLVVVPFDPVLDLTSAERFRAHYGIDESVVLLGGFSGRLDNAGERVRLSRPDEPPLSEPDFVPLLIEDETVYDDQAPWPVEADGQGASLTRATPPAWGHDATAWSAADPTPGTVAGDQPPRVVAIELNRDVADPDNLPSGPQHTSWSNQRSTIRSLSIVFSEPVQVSAGDLALTNLGVNSPIDADDVVALEEHQLTMESNVLTISFAPRALEDGVYRLEVLASIIDLTGNALDGDADGVGGDDFVLAGDDQNRLYQLTGEWSGDGGVSIFDFTTFAYWFGQVVPRAPQYVDLSDDMGISIFDFTAFGREFGRSVTYPTGLSAAAWPIVSAGDRQIGRPPEKESRLDEFVSHRPERQLSQHEFTQPGRTTHDVRLARDQSALRAELLEQVLAELTARKRGLEPFWRRSGENGQGSW